MDFEHFSWPAAVVLGLLIVAIASHEMYKTHASNQLAIEAVKAGLEQGELGKWVHPRGRTQGQGYGGSPGHLTPQEVEALYTKPKDK